MRRVRTTLVLALSSLSLRSRRGRNINALQRAALALLALLATIGYANAQSGAWTPLNNPFPGCITDAALLLTDGRVLEHDYCSVNGNPGGTDWYAFTPDRGSYVNGTWARVASIPSGFGYGPFSFFSAVLPDGRVIVEGGEYNFNGLALNQGAIYDPVANTWTQVIPPDFGDMCDQNGQISKTGHTYWCGIGESPSLVLADGSFMIGSSEYTSSYPYLSKLEALLPPPYTGPWVQTGFFKNDGNSEQGATLLPNPVLSLDPTLSLVVTTDTYHGFGHYGTLPTPICAGFPTLSPGWHSSELYSEDDPGYGSWLCLGDTQVQLWAGDDSGPPGLRLSYDEMGPMVLRPDGTAVQFGANTNSATAILSNAFPPTWSKGPSFPTDKNGDRLTVADGPAALLPNGNILVAASPARDTPPTVFFELTAAPSNTLMQVSGPSYASQLASSGVEMLMLPTGEVWLTPNRGYGGNIIEIYSSLGTVNQAWAPTISGCRPLCTFSKSNVNNRITGTQFNGLSQDSAFGDEFQSATNYPLVRIIEDQDLLKPYYCRTHDHGVVATGGVSMGVATGSEPVYTEFDCSNTGLRAFTYGYLEVVANGINSLPVRVYITP